MKYRPCVELEFVVFACNILTTSAVFTEYEGKPLQTDVTNAVTVGVNINERMAEIFMPAGARHCRMQVSSNHEPNLPGARYYVSKRLTVRPPDLLTFPKFHFAITHLQVSTAQSSTTAHFPGVGHLLKRIWVYLRKKILVSNLHFYL